MILKLVSLMSLEAYTFLLEKSQATSCQFPPKHTEHVPNQGAERHFHIYYLCITLYYIFVCIPFVDEGNHENLCTTNFSVIMVTI